MYLPCESIGQRILPIFRSYIAKELIEKYNFTQIEAAKKLGTTQAAISQYLHSKRGCKELEQFKGILPMVQFAASELASEIASDKISPKEITLKFCKLCTLIQKKSSK